MGGAIISSVLFTFRWCMVERGRGWPVSDSQGQGSRAGSPTYRLCNSLSIRMFVSFNLYKKVNNL